LIFGKARQVVETIFFSSNHASEWELGGSTCNGLAGVGFALPGIENAVKADLATTRISLPNRRTAAEAAHLTSRQAQVPTVPPHFSTPTQRKLLLLRKVSAGCLHATTS